MGNISLYTLSVGDTARDVFYNHIKENGYMQSLLVVPNRTMLQEAEKKNIRAVVFDALLKEILRQDTEHSYTEIDNYSKQCLMDKAICETEELNILSSMMVKAEDGTIMPKSGLSEALVRFRNELNNACVTIEELKACSATAPELAEDLKNIFANYETLLKTGDGSETSVYVDMESKYSYATTLLNCNKATVSYSYIAFTDFYKFTPLQLKFIEALKVNSAAKIDIGLQYEEEKAAGICSTIGPSSSRLSQLADNVIAYNSQETAHEDIATLRKNFTSEYSLQNFGTSQNIALNSFVNREEEMRWIMADIKKLLLSEGENKEKMDLKAQKIAVAVRNLDDYASLRDIADEYGVPVTQPLTTGLTSQPLVEFLRLLFGAVENTPEGAKSYFKLLNSAIIRQCFKTVDSWLLEMPSECYFTSRRQAQRQCNYKAEEQIKRYGKPKEQAGEKLSAREAVDKLINAVETLKDKTISGYVELINNILDGLKLESKLGYRFKNNKLDEMSIKNVLLTKKAIKLKLNMIKKEYASTDSEEDWLEVSNFAEIFANEIQDVKLTLKKGSPNGIRIAKVVDMQGLKYDHVYILGVRQDEFPAKLSESWLLSNENRKQYNLAGLSHLITKEDLYAEDAFFFINAVAAAKEKLTLTWFRDEGVAEAEGGASLYIGYVRSLFAGLECQGLKYNTISSTYEKSISMLMKKAESSQEDLTTDSYLQGIHMPVNVPGNDKFTVWEKATKSPLSASKLEKYRNCPLRFLAENVWGVKDCKAMDDTPKASHKGTVFHDTLENFVMKVFIPTAKGKTFAQLTEEERVDYEAKLLDLFEESSKEAERKGMLGGPLWEAEKNLQRKKLKQWLDFECNCDPKLAMYKPIATEWSFGFDEKEPFIIKIKGEDGADVDVRFCGKVDRIDTDGKYYYIVDYKTGTAPNKDDIQIPLYILAASDQYIFESGSLEPVGGSYLELKKLPKHMAEIFYLDPENMDLGFDSKAKLEEEKYKITDILQKMYDGEYNMASVKSNCGYCPMKKYCSRNMN